MQDVLPYRYRLCSNQSRLIRIPVTAFQDVLIQTSNHIRQLHLSMSLGTYTDPEFLFLPSDRVGQLEYLDLSSSRLATKQITVFQSAPRLRKVKITLYNLEWLGTTKSPILFPWVQLTHLDIRTPIHITVLQSVLRKCTFLHRCRFTVSEYSQPSSIPDLDRTKTILPCLNAMELDLLDTHRLSQAPYTWFASFAFPVLTTFALRRATLSSNWLHHFQQALQYQAHSLHYLKLDIFQVDINHLCTFLHLHSELTTLNIWLIPSSPRALWEAMTFNDEAGSDSAVETLPLLPQLERLEIRVPRHRHEVDFAWPEFITMIKSRWNRRQELVSGVINSRGAVARLRSIELNFEEMADESKAADVITLLESYRSEGMDVLISRFGPAQPNNMVEYDPFEWRM